jgi:Nickel responsive protein SCO4226-like
MMRRRTPPRNLAAVAGPSTFLVERYIARLQFGDVERIGSRLASVTDEMQAEGRAVEWIRSIALPDDETCLCIFTACTPVDVEEANRRAGTGYERIVQTLTVERAAIERRL